MLLRLTTGAARRTTLTIFSALQNNRDTTQAVLTNYLAQRLSRASCIAELRKVSTNTIKDKKSEAYESLEEDTVARTAIDEEPDPDVGNLLELIEQSRVVGDSKRELEQLLKLSDVLKRRNQQDAEVFEVAFSIAQLYDAQLENTETATKYYEEALKILKEISTEVTAWGAHMRLTTLGALAVCYENLGQAKKAAKYFEDAIGTYEEHCDKASTLDDSEADDSALDVLLLADFNATAAMIHYHYAGNLLAQDCWEEAKTVTNIALTLAENSNMPLEDLEKLQQCIHDIWLEID